MATDLVFASEVTDEAVQVLLDKVMAALEGGEQEFRLFLTTYGGELACAFTFYDRIQQLIREGVITIFSVTATGFCLSAGTLMLQAGTERVALPHTVFMLHQPGQFPWEDHQAIDRDEVLARIDLQEALVDLLAEIFAHHCIPQDVGCDAPVSFWAGRFATMRQEFFKPEMALRLGLVDRIESVW